MKPLNESDIRRSIVNASKGEIERMPLPGLHEVLWGEREYLGWRDHDAPLRGYLVHWADDRAVGIVLRASGARMRPGISAMCSLCRTPQPSDQVTLFPRLEPESPVETGIRLAPTSAPISRAR